MTLDHPSVSALPPKPADTRYRSLDLWRGLACLMLVLFHATFYTDYAFQMTDPGSWTWGGLPLNLVTRAWIGVPMFFVISGYCIAGSLDSLRRRPLSLASYFGRRMRRIYPPLWVMCGLALGYVLWMSTIPLVREQCLQLPRLEDFSVWHWLGNLTATESWRHHVGGGNTAYLLPNTWTLCYEEQFYLVAGLMLAFAPRRIFPVTVALTAVVLVMRHALRGWGVACDGFFWDGHWIMFAAGISLYHAIHYASRHVRRWILWSYVAGMIYAAVDRWSVTDGRQQHLSEYLFVALGFALALYFAYPFDRRIVNQRWLAPLAWCGQRSYSIYLTHYLIVVVASSLLAYWGIRSEPAVVMITVPLCVLVSLPVASLFYHTVECRFLNSPAFEGDLKQRSRQSLARQKHVVPGAIIADRFSLISRWYGNSSPAP